MRLHTTAIKPYMISIYNDNSIEVKHTRIKIPTNVAVSVCKDAMSAESFMSIGTEVIYDS